MIKNILSLTNKLVPSYLGLKGLEKLNPKLQRFITSSAGAGYGADAVMDFIRDRMQGSSAKAEKNRLEEGLHKGNLRPDEKASLQEINNSQQKTDTFQKAASTGIGLAGGLALNAVEGLGGLASSNEEPPSDMPQQEKELLPGQQSLEDILWQRAQQGKTKVGDPDVTEFLKTAHQLIKYRGLNDRREFDQLWNQFRQMKESGLPIEQIVQSLIGAYNPEGQMPNFGGVQPRQSQGQQQGQPNQATEQLMQALQLAAEARKRRQ